GGAIRETVRLRLFLIVVSDFLSLLRRVRRRTGDALAGLLDRQRLARRLLVVLQPVPVREIVGRDGVVLDDDAVVGLRAEPGLGPVGAAGHDGDRPVILDVYRKLVVADPRRRAEHAVDDAILFLAGGGVQLPPRIIVLGIPDDRLSLLLRRALRI